jgi:DNA replication protein DnaC
MKAFSEFEFTPRTFTRDGQCAQHGAYQETGGSISGREDRVRWFGCPACNKTEREAEEVEAKANEEQARQARIEARLNASGIPLAFRGRTFDNFLVEGAEMQHAVDVVREFALNFWSKHSKQGSFLVLGGVTGTGKSHLALAAAQQVMARGTAMYMDAMDLIRRVRGTWRRDSDKSEEEMIGLLGSIDLLIIDEVGVQRGTDDEQMIVFDVLNRRYRDNRATILLTNLDGRAFTEFMGPRVMSRLSERAQYVSFKWDDWRRRGMVPSADPRHRHATNANDPLPSAASIERRVG